MIAGKEAEYWHPMPDALWLTEKGRSIRHCSSSPAFSLVTTLRASTTEDLILNQRTS